MTYALTVVGVLIWILIGVWVADMWYHTDLDQRHPVGGVVVVLGWPGIAIIMLIYMVIATIRRPRL